ncbi:YHYH protein [Portibacter lacus]|uniref:YHYH domain-containing protein n=1 Tax=Portibacter lacus TaxID=1099794 RepID=A0AA37SS92_9BACT|nr:YHYH protein [Portibacter lacus]GLR18699.1 hypothetical protein GCM10007940_33150 [Portibacter lacus]
MKNSIIILLAFVVIVFASCKTKGHVHHSEIDKDTDFTKSYTLVDEQYGTKTKVSIKGESRIMETNALPNHETGSFPNSHNPNTISAQKQRYTFPTKPVYTGTPKMAKEPGVALNGVKFDPGTAERAECESGEVYRIEAIQDFADLGLDFNNAHVQPTGAYHYHGVSTNLVDKFDQGGDLIHVGYALDGFRIMYSKSGAYTPGYKLSTELRQGSNCTYKNPQNSMDMDLTGTKPDGTFTSDWVYDSSIGNLDECNGIEVDGEYVYLITESYPFVSRCLMGEFEEVKRGPGPGGQRPGGQGGPPRRPGGRG